MNKHFFVLLQSQNIYQDEKKYYLYDEHAACWHVCFDIMCQG